MCYRGRLHILEIGFRVDELVDPVDLQGAILVQDEGCVDHRFVGRIGPVSGPHFVGEL